MRIGKVAIDPNWKARLEGIGYGYHSEGGVPYWSEDQYFEITMRQADELYAASATLWDMCLKAVAHVISHKKYDAFNIPPYIVHHIERSWNEDAPSVYGRFDLAYNPNSGLIKLLEFNADTPTSLFECAVVQWYWKQHYFSDNTDQYNSIHEQLIQTWTDLKPHLKGEVLHFTCLKESLEDLTNVEYLRDTAIQAGISTKLVYIDDIGWNGQQFVDLEDASIKSMFKLYPWEWLVQEEFGHNIINDINDMQWIEPSWKMLLSNKAILAVLWELYPNHRLLLPAYLDGPRNMTKYVKKPILAREGANVSMYYNNEKIYETEGDYGDEGYVYQELAQLHKSDLGHSVVGSWIIGEEPCGISFRTSEMPVTNNTSRFVPHIIR